MGVSQLIWCWGRHPISSPTRFSLENIVRKSSKQLEFDWFIFSKILIFAEKWMNTISIQHHSTSFNIIQQEWSVSFLHIPTACAAVLWKCQPWDPYISIAVIGQSKNLFHILGEECLNPWNSSHSLNQQWRPKCNEYDRLMISFPLKRCHNWGLSAIPHFQSLAKFPFLVASVIRIDRLTHVKTCEHHPLPCCTYCCCMLLLVNFRILMVTAVTTTFCFPRSTSSVLGGQFWGPQLAGQRLPPRSCPGGIVYWLYTLYVYI